MEGTVEQQVGTDVAGYRIEELIGRGGMGFVYLATQMHLGRKVALKLLAPELTEDPKFRERFIRESQLAASLEHPNIVPIYDANEVGGQLFLAMRYVAGTDLKRLIAEEGTLDAERTISILSQAASALDAAHAEGLIHRDVKPGNILLTPRPDPTGTDRVYLSDFGLTKRATSDSGITATGQFVGTLDYAAPEQFEGKPLDARTDVYSLGCVLYECLTGEVPFPRDNQAGLVYAHLMGTPPKVTDKRPDLPGAIDAVVSKAMAKTPQDRHPSAGELIEASSQALGVAPAAPTTAPTPTRPVTPSPRRRRTGLLVAGGAAALAAIVLLVVLLNGGGETPAGTGPSIGAGASLTDYVARVDPLTGQVSGQIKVGKDPVGVAVAEGSAWVANGGDDTVSRIDPVTGKVTARIVVGKRPFAIVAGEGAVWVANHLESSVSKIDPATNQVTTIDVGGVRPHAMAVGDGALWVASWIASGSATPVSVQEIDVSTGRLVREVVFRVLGGLGIGDNLAMAAGGGSMWAGTYDGLLRFETQTGKLIQRVSLGKPIAAISLQGDSVWVAANGTPGTVFEVDSHSQQLLQTIPGGGGDGRPMQVAADDKDVWVTDTVSGSVSRIVILSGLASPPVDVGKVPTGVALGLGSVWVTVDGR